MYTIILAVFTGLITGFVLGISDVASWVWSVVWGVLAALVCQMVVGFLLITSFSGTRVSNRIESDEFFTQSPLKNVPERMVYAVTTTASHHY